MNRKGKDILILAVIVALTVCVGLLAINGAQFGKWRLKPVGEAISLGLDLRGGVYAVYKAKDPSQENLDTLIDGTINIMRTRLSDKGYNEATVTKQGSDRIRIEIPDVQDPASVLDIIGTPAHLEFRTTDGEVVITGDDVQSATAVTDAAGSEYKVRLVLNESGKEAFAKATSENIGKTISIYLDDDVISSPRVNSAITGGEAVIEGNFTLDSARELASLIQSGALPLDIEQDEVSAVSATLGVDVIERAVRAGVIGVVLVMLFMIVMYRMSGLLASLALTIYIIIVFYLMALVPGIQLTLPGIAGVVLAIGMAVDANVIIFERIREELQDRPHDGFGHQARLQERPERNHRLQRDHDNRLVRAYVLRHRCDQGLCQHAVHRRCGIDVHRDSHNPRTAQVHGRRGRGQPQAVCALRGGGAT